MKAEHSILRTMGYVCLLVASTLGQVLAQSNADISLINKTATTSSIETGRPFIYTVTFACSGADSCKDVIITDTLPLGLEYVGQTGLDAFVLSNPFNGQVLDYFAGGNAFDFSAPAYLVLGLGDLAPGVSGSLQLLVRFQQHGMIPNGFTVQNSAFISSSNDLDPNNNNLGSATVSAEAESKWGIRKIALPGSLLFDVSAPSTAYDSLTFYQYSIDKPGGFSDFNNYFTDSTSYGQLAIDTPLVVDYLEAGLTCADIDPMFTSPGYTCLAPGASYPGSDFVNTSSQFAVVWDMRDPQLIGPGPFYTAGPCGYGLQSNCGPFGPATGTSPREAGFSRFDWDTAPFFILAVRYELGPFQNMQQVCNTIELHGANPINGLSGNFGPLQLQASDTKCHDLVPPNPMFNAVKVIFSVVEHTDSVYIGEEVVQESVLSNNGNVVLTGTCVKEILPSELDVERIQAKGSYQGTFTVTLFYTDNTTEVVTNFPQAGVLRRSMGDFTVPTGEFVDSILFCADALLPPGQSFRLSVRGPALPNRWRDDRNTVQVTSPDPGNQLSGSTVQVGEWITDCSHFYADGVESDTICNSVVVSKDHIRIAFAKQVSPTSEVLPGDTLTFKLILDRYIGGTEVTNLTWTDTLPPFLQFTGQGDVTISGECFNNMTNTISVSSTPNINGSNRELVSFVIDGMLPFFQTGPTCNIEFKAVILPNHPAGIFTNDACITSYGGNPGGIYEFNSGNLLVLDPQGNTQDPNADPPTNCKQTAYQIASLPAAAVNKKAFSGMSGLVAGLEETLLVQPGDVVQYTLTFKNTGNTPLFDVTLVDLFPAIGDVGPLTLTPRNSAWGVNGLSAFIGANTNKMGGVTPVITYTDDANPCRENLVINPPSNPFPPGCSGGFQAIVPNPSVTGIAVSFPQDTFEVGDTVSVTFEINLPGIIPPGTAFNNFAWKATDQFTGNVEIGAESPNVGMAGPASIGNRVWCDQNDNGIYDPNFDVIPPDGVTLYLYVAGDSTTPVDTATLVNGQFLFDNLVPGDYFILIPATEFAAGGLLDGYTASMAPAGMPNANIDDDVDHNGLNGTGVFFGGVLTGALALGGGEENLTLDIALRCVSCDVEISAGDAATICSNEAVDLTNINAFIQGGTSNGQWSSSGSGTFVGGMDFGVATAYVPSAEDVEAGTVILTLTSEDFDGNGPCESVSAAVQITILKVDCGTFPWTGPAGQGGQ